MVTGAARPAEAALRIRSELLTRFGGASVLASCEQCGACSSACPLTGIDGFNIRRIIRHVELGLIDEIALCPLPWRCTTCARCMDACPNGVDILGIIRHLRELTPPERLPDGPPPCVKACPAAIDVPGYVRLLAQGRPDEAYRLILNDAPLPGVLGRVCPHPCEDLCRRGEVNAPVSACALKRFAADHKGTASVSDLPVAADSGRGAAVIGAGPSGLSAAVFLRRMGHRVTVFEARSQPGGMMRYGIPRYRLPLDVLDDEIAELLDLGIGLEVGRKLGKDIDLESLRAEGYDAIYLALGLQHSHRIRIPGAEHDDVKWGLDFLGDVNIGREVIVGDRLVVIGGGNVAVDVALTALRLGARQVTMACLEQRDEMPASPWEVNQAVTEGVALLPGWGPAAIQTRLGLIGGVELVECTSAFDGDGRFSPTYGEGRSAVEADQVILAVGQAADLAGVADGTSLEVEHGLIRADDQTQATDQPGVFAGGDVTRGPGTIVEAIAAGKRAARAIDRFLGGTGVPARAPSLAADLVDAYDGRRARGFADQERATMPMLPLDERRGGFLELELGLSEDQAVREARRCLQCDLERLLVERCHRG